MSRRPLVVSLVVVGHAVGLFVVATGYVLGMEPTPSGPTFRDVAELEGLAKPTGITVMSGSRIV